MYRSNEKERGRIMNKFIMLGRITKDPELKYTEKQIPVAIFTIAINRPMQEEKRTDFITIKTFNKLAENIHKYCKKGSQISVEGTIQNNNYIDKDGNKRYEYSFIGQRAEFLSKPTNDSQKEETSQNKPKISGLNDEIFREFGESIEISDEDLAF